MFKSRNKYQHFIDNQLLNEHNLLIMNMQHLAPPTRRNMLDLT